MRCPGKRGSRTGKRLQRARPAVLALLAAMLVRVGIAGADEPEAGEFGLGGDARRPLRSPGYRNRAASSVSIADSAAWRSALRPSASEVLVTEPASAPRRRARAALSPAMAG
jgi:hypothetical protein